MSTRRNFLRSAGLAGSWLAGSAWVACAAAHADDLRRRHKACILLWMQGGPSQFETFSPLEGHANGGGKIGRAHV